MGEVAPCQNITAVYHPRNPTDSPLYYLLQNHFEHFEQMYDDKFEKDYGFYRQVISDVLYAYLKCGDLKEGFSCVIIIYCGDSTSLGSKISVLDLNAGEQLPFVMTNSKLLQGRTLVLSVIEYYKQIILNTFSTNYSMRIQDE